MVRSRTVRIGGQSYLEGSSSIDTHRPTAFGSPLCNRHPAGDSKVEIYKGFDGKIFEGEANVLGVVRRYPKSPERA